jgi:hypothetical protein
MIFPENRYTLFEIMLLSLSMIFSENRYTLRDHAFRTGSPMIYRHLLRRGMSVMAPAVALLAGAPATALPARAADYPWCYIDQTMSGATYCAFETLAQCRENAGGNGGVCVQNPDYRGTSGQHVRRSPRR